MLLKILVATIQHHPYRSPHVLQKEELLKKIYLYSALNKTWSTEEVVVKMGNTSFAGSKLLKFAKNKFTLCGFTIFKCDKLAYCTSKDLNSSSLLS